MYAEVESSHGRCRGGDETLTESIDAGVAVRFIISAACTSKNAWKIVFHRSHCQAASFYVLQGRETHCRERAKIHRQIFLPYRSRKRRGNSNAEETLGPRNLCQLRKRLVKADGVDRWISRKAGFAYGVLAGRVSAGGGPSRL